MWRLAMNGVPALVCERAGGTWGFDLLLTPPAVLLPLFDDAFQCHPDPAQCGTFQREIAQHNS